ncbi:MAG: hypothetical protein QMB65_04485, partial [Vicingaceae bacterium]
ALYHKNNISSLEEGYGNTYIQMRNNILTSRDVMKILSICENTLLKYERNGVIIIDFRIGNRKRYYLENIISSLKKKR